MARLDEYEGLLRPASPWLVRMRTETSSAALVKRLAKDGILARVCDGSRMGGEDGFYAELARAFAFPSVPRNGNALLDWFTDLAWLRHPGGYACIVEHRKQMLSTAPAPRRERCRETLEHVGVRWADPSTIGQRRDRVPTPFHVVLLP